MDYDNLEGNEVIEVGNNGNGEQPAEANKIRVTTPYMTKYERARILGTRALQIRLVSRFIASDIYWFFGTLKKRS